MKQVEIKHPDVAVTAFVPESSLPHHAAKGWSRVDEGKSSGSKSGAKSTAARKGSTRASRAQGSGTAGETPDAGEGGYTAEDRANDDSKQ